MPNNPDYARSVDTAANRIRETVPADLVERFGAVSGISPGDFHPCTPKESGEICAVDGSNVVLIESGSMALVLFRAAQSTFYGRKRGRRSLSPLTFAIIGPGAENRDFPELYRECFGEAPGTPLGNEDRTRTAGVLRDTLEYWIAEQMAGNLERGALLLRDGPLRVSHASHDPVLVRIEEACRARDIDLAGVSKRTTATWGGGHPVLPSVKGLAEHPGDPCPLVGPDRPGHPRSRPVPPVAARADVYRLPAPACPVPAEDRTPPGSTGCTGAGDHGPSRGLFRGRADPRVPVPPLRCPPHGRAHRGARGTGPVRPDAADRRDGDRTTDL